MNEKRNLYTNKRIIKMGTKYNRRCISLKEVRFISSQLNCKFIHVLCGANEAADAVVKEASVV